MFYKGLFLSLGYGSIGKVANVKFELGEYTEDVIKERTRIGHGLCFNVGYNLITNAPGFFLGVSGGLTYDVVNKVVAPSVSLKMGMSFEWEKY